jgi:hypothetical protein
MKPQELRIGNLVCYNGKVVKVEQVTKRKIGYHTKPNETRMNYARLCEIEPIPITEELLLKTGFLLPEHKEFYVMCRINGKDNSIRLTRYFNLWNAEIFASHPEVVMLEHTIKGLRFVHELQNAYYLVTGKELEIKL